MKYLNCKFIGHKLSQVSTQPLLIKEYQCSRCQQKFTEDGYGRIVRLTQFWEENHKVFHDYFRKRVIS